MDEPKNPVRLTVVIGSLDRGGAERHLLQVLPRLSSHGFSVTVYCLRSRGELAPEMERQGVQVLGETDRSPTLGMRYINLVKRASGLLLYLLRNRPQIVHFFLPAAYILGAPAAIIARCRIRMMSRRSQNNYQKHLIWSRFIERQWHRRMSAVLGNSRNVINQLVGEGVPESKLYLVYNGIDLAAFGQNIPRPVARANLGLGREALIFVIVANLIPYKGHADLLRAFARIKDRLPKNWVLLCAGRDDGIGKNLQDIVEDLGLSQRVHWLGSVKDIPSLLAAADVALLTSHEEGFSNALIEYMATGLPAIATDVGGNAEAVIDGQTGLIVPSRNPEALAEAILRLALDPELRQTMGARAQALTRERYSLKACVENYVALYRKILKDHGLD